MKTINELKASPVLYLSGGSKELFHSNFLYWLGVNYRDAFQELVAKICCINASWPENWIVRREHLHLDLCVTYEKETGKTRKGKPVREECAFIIIENKVKSLPDLVQLRKYEQVYTNHDSGCTYMVLSLVKDFPGQKCLKINTCWQLHHYDELAELIRECCSDSVISQEHRPYIRDYCQFVENLSKLAEEWRIDEQESFLSQRDDLRELRLNDIYEKVRYAQIAALLAEKLKTGIVNDIDEERVILGMSNTDIILRRGRDDADEILAFYGCPEAKPFQQVFISSGMSHGVGLVEATVKIAEDCCLVIQVQGNHYCHAMERENIFENTGKLSMLQILFMNFRLGGLKDRLAEADSEICHYKTDFVYRWQKILPSHTVADIIDAMVADVIRIWNQEKK
jgi:hypothetical protein